MNNEKQRIAIAEACGHGDYSTQMNGWHDNQIHGLPDYLNDLNSMHAAITTRLQGYEEHFFYELSNVVNDEAKPHLQDDMHYIVNATAAQRAEAFLRTIGKWEDE